MREAFDAEEYGIILLMKKHANQGLISILLIIVIAILALSFFNIDLKTVAEKPQTQKNVSYVVDNSTSFWNTYLQKPASYLWNDIFINLLWNSFVDNMTRIKQDQPTTLQLNPPTVQMEPATPVR